MQLLFRPEKSGGNIESYGFEHLGFRVQKLTRGQECLSNACWTGRTPARTQYPRICISYRLRHLPVANSLSRVVPDSHRRMIYEFAMRHSCDAGTKLLFTYQCTAISEQ
jgi:hypothetical protein